MTVTLAELYVKQGLIGPDAAAAEAARKRLAELPSAEAGVALLEELLERVRARKG